jgi:hypothetical protein
MFDTQQQQVHIVQESLDQLLLEGIITDAFHFLQIRNDSPKDVLKPIQKPLKLKLKLNVFRAKKQEYVFLKHNDTESDKPQCDKYVVTFRI